MAYMLDHEGHREFKRLQAIERVLDPFTVRALELLGVGSGWSCLEVGAGAGSIARWLVGRVGSNGRVVATELETKFVEALDVPGLEVWRHDVRVDDLDAGMFDLIHARAVLEHLPERDVVVGKMVSALKPGGVLLVGSGDYVSFVSGVPAHEDLFERGVHALLTFMGRAGFDPFFGRRVGTVFREHGLEDVEVEGRVIEWGGARAATPIWLHVVERFEGMLVEAGLLSAGEASAFHALLASGEFVAFSPIFAYARGRRAR